MAGRLLRPIDAPELPFTRSLPGAVVDDQGRIDRKPRDIGMGSDKPQHRIDAVEVFSQVMDRQRSALQRADSGRRRVLCALPRQIDAYDVHTGQARQRPRNMRLRVQRYDAPR